jgi:hypothetical protein
MNKEFLKMQKLAGLITENQIQEIDQPIEENLELIVRYYLAKQLEEILSVNDSVESISSELINIINKYKNVKSVDELYAMLDDFGYDEMSADINDIKNWELG